MPTAEGVSVLMTDQASPPREESRWSGLGINGFVLSLLLWVLNALWVILLNTSDETMSGGALGVYTVVLSVLFLGTFLLSLAGIGETNRDADPKKRGIHLSVWGAVLSAIPVGSGVIVGIVKLVSTLS